MDKEFFLGLLIVLSAIFGFVLPFIVPISEVLEILIVASIILSFIWIIVDSSITIGDFLVKAIVFLIIMFIASMVGGVIHAFLFNIPLNNPITGGRYYYV